MGHLPESAPLEDYHSVILSVLSDTNSVVYHYPFGVRDYYGVSGTIRGLAWLVLFAADGILETAFPPDDAADCLRRHGFVPLGRLGEIVYE